jgi:UDP-N-acetylmuramyl pentapeptide phosphotransferase/UDP-N-acetylglucosamine-1-phosphate transferase
LKSLLLLAVSLGASAWLTRQLCRPSSRFYFLDHPNERSLHTRPTPRTGGLAIVIAGYLSAGAAACWLGSGRELSWVAAAVLLVAAVSYADDRIGLAARYRLVSHIVAAIVVMFGGLRLSSLGGSDLMLPSMLVLPLTLLFIVWMINLYNFMDGMDGFAGGMAVFGFGAFAVMGWMTGHEIFSVMSLIVAAASAGFLAFNFPPARIFMGDVGSSTLGLMAATFALWGAQDDVFPFWAAILIFSPFIADATVTLLRRLWRHEKIWQAHKTHYYQRLVQAGWGHRRTVLWEYVLMAACAGSAIWAVRQPETVQWWVNGFWAAAYAMLIAMVHRLAPSRSSFDGRL